MSKRIVMAHAGGVTLIDPKFCTHPKDRLHFYEAGGWFTTMGEVDDNVKEYCVCLDCGAHIEPPAEPIEHTDEPGIEF